MSKRNHQIVVISILIPLFILSALAFTSPQDEPIVASLAGGADLYFISATEGKIYRYDTSSGNLEPVYTSKITTGLFSLSLGGENGELLYFTNTNTHSLYMLSSGEAREIYRHSSYVRVVRVRYDKNMEKDVIYFSESYGASTKNKILKLSDSKAELYMNVSKWLDFWAGDFDIAPDGTVYLTSGNTIPAYIYKVKDGKFEKIAGYRFPLKGVRYVENVPLKVNGSDLLVKRGLLIAGYTFHRVYLYDLDARKIYTIYNNPDIKRIEDVALFFKVPPVLADMTQISVGEPRYLKDSVTYISPETKIQIKAISGKDSGLKIWYSVDDGDWKLYSEPITLKGFDDGKHVISFYGENKYGTKEVAKSAVFNVDSTPPQVTFSLQENIIEVESFPAVIVLTFSVNDTGSGIKRIALFVNGQKKVFSEKNGRYEATLSLEEGEYTVKVVAVDNVGNTRVHQHRVIIQSKISEHEENVESKEGITQSSTLDLTYILALLLAIAIISVILILRHRRTRTG